MRTVSVSNQWEFWSPGRNWKSPTLALDCCRLADGYFRNKMSENCAVPLCLPNNSKWDEQTGEYSRDEDQDRTSLYVIDAALERLRNVKGKFIPLSMHFYTPSLLPASFVTLVSLCFFYCYCYCLFIPVPATFHVEWLNFPLPQGSYNRPSQYIFFRIPLPDRNKILIFN